VALDVALGLNYLHSQRPPMMHRDLKSPNVLLSEEGVAKIADVGMVSGALGAAVGLGVQGGGASCAGWGLQQAALPASWQGTGRRWLCQCA
jgi:serine/threonine protein kinase